MEKAMAPHCSTLAWKIPWMEEPGRLQSMGSLRVGQEWATSLSLFTFMHWRRKWQPTPVFLPGESQGRQNLVGCRLWGRTELDTTEVTQQQHTLGKSVCKCYLFLHFYSSKHEEPSDDNHIISQVRQTSQILAPPFPSCETWPSHLTFLSLRSTKNRTLQNKDLQETRKDIMIKDQSKKKM